ncbi:hypothetical protein Pisl_1550 [Pyrobaculum islandicum DSM 4184]|uniref:Uncharacterized protein n=1 Tax=Pyrobaculum islandicum (strain DSM 4184 / JCM 9189 / GEO3) TaxID=384616 RepID=A1RUS3_PYRIL|nr:hypothetical protein [Pyrobaculum islandicum]ABL88705.1 hypothetical protein Pisl_1550 [Pyrobaculum islandicum DSM 4184]
MRELALDYALAQNEPAEIKAAKQCLEKGRCTVLTRDYDPLTVINEEIQPIKISQRAWIVRKITVDRKCLTQQTQAKTPP